MIGSVEYISRSGKSNSRSWREQIGWWWDHFIFFLSYYMQKKPSSWIDHVEGHTSVGQRPNHRPIMCPLHTWDAKVVIWNGWYRGQWWWWKEFYAHHLFLLLCMLIPFFFSGIWEHLLTKIIPDNYRSKKGAAFSPPPTPKPHIYLESLPFNRNGMDIREIEWVTETVVVS